MPTFLLYKDGNKIGDLVGAVPQKLEVSIEWHSLIDGFNFDLMKYIGLGTRKESPPMLNVPSSHY